MAEMVEVAVVLEDVAVGQLCVEQFRKGPNHVPPARLQRAQLQKIQLPDEIQQGPSALPSTKHECVVQLL